MTFRPTSQALADKMTIHTQDGRDTGDIRITCYQDGAATVVPGFIDLHNEESLTIGWNCELSGEEIRIPAVATELLDSRFSDNAAVRRKKGSRPFSLVAANSAGTMVTGVTSNDRGSRFNKMMSRDRASATTADKTSTSSTTFSTLIIAAATSGGLVTITALAYYCSRLRNLLHCHRRNYNSQATSAA